MREADVAQRGRRIGDGGGGTEEQPHRPDRLAAGEFGALCDTARELYQKGEIGDVEMVELTLGRNDPTGAWEYPPPPDLSPETLDWDTWLNDAPKIPFNQASLRALALLEGLRHRRRRRSDGPPDQRHARDAGLE